MEKEYEKNRRDYIQISSEARNKLTALSVVVIGAIYFFSSSNNTLTFKISLLFLFLTIASETASSFLKSQHYALWIEGKIDSLDFRKSIFGKISENFFWLPIITFTIGSIFFFIGLFSSENRPLPENQDRMMQYHFSNHNHNIN